MAKIILGKTPKSFVKELTFPMLDGTVGSIKVTYQYRTRPEFAAFVDAMLDVIKSEAAAEMAADAEALKQSPDVDLGVSEVEANRRKTARQVDYIMDAVTAWNLDVPFDRDAVEQLAHEVPQAVTSIITMYREAMTEGRLGN